MYDLIIIGASAAGTSAAIYAARRNLNTLIISKNLGGEVALSGEVNNWPGIQKIAGFQLANDFVNHAKSYNVPIEEGLEVTRIDNTADKKIVYVKNDNGEEKTFETKTVIIASGIHPRPLGIPGEEKLRGRGVTYCTVCDGPLYRRKTTVTVGAGNSGLESALMMAELAEKVFLVSMYEDTPETNGGFPRGENVLIDKVKNHPKIEVVYNSKTEAIEGENFVTGLVVSDNKTNEKHTLPVQGVMVHIGMIPNSKFADLEKNPMGEIVINMKCETNVPGIFAAGDVTNTPYKQIAIAAGQGVTAALSAIDYLNKKQ
ncbi:MAG TPA: FAD-dependent oxidoreductase [Candidatus Magasanikbacteria bacterium]|nr:FAD-dependent oxidoreductase [Candidatus Magasanikbacteria bacterium]